MQRMPKSPLPHTESSALYSYRTAINQIYILLYNKPVLLSSHHKKRPLGIRLHNQTPRVFFILVLNLDILKLPSE